MRKPRIKGDKSLALYRQQLGHHQAGLFELYYSECSFCRGWAEILLAMADWTLTDLLMSAEAEVGLDG